MSRRSRKHSDTNPYKRQKTAEPTDPIEDDEIVEETEQPTGAIEPGQMAQLIVDMRNGAVDRQAANAISGPLNDLAKAFAMQAEILRGVHETQVELKDTIQKDRKAEMMVNATDSLNTTFKGVKSVQQKLLDELDDRGKRSRSNVNWAIGASLAILVTIVGLFWWKDQMDSEKSRDLEERLAATTAKRADALDLKIEALAGTDSSAEEWKALAEDARKDLRKVENEKEVLVARTDDLQRSLKEARSLSSAESAELDRLRRESAAIKPELERLRKKLKESDVEFASTLKRLEASRKEADHLRLDVIAKLNRSGAERIAGKLEDEATRKTIIAKGEAEAAKAVMARVPAEKVKSNWTAERVVDDLTDLMSEHRHSRIYRVESIGKVGKHFLEDVVITESARGRGVIKRVRAKKLDVTISGRGDIVELNFRDGDVQQKTSGGAMGKWTSFYNSRYRVTIYCQNGEDWKARNYGFFVVN